MQEPTAEPGQRALEERARALFRESVENLDMALRSRLTRARYAAIAAAEPSPRRSWLPRSPFSAAMGVTAAALLGIALWFGTPLHHGLFGVHGTDGQWNFEDLDLVAAVDESSADAMEMLQDDIDFYDWAEKAASQEPAA